MIKINKIINSSKNTEISTISLRIIEIYKDESLHKDTHLDLLVNSLIILSEKLILAINKFITKSNLEEKDKLRKKEIQNLHYILLGSIYNPLEEIKTPGIQIYNVFKNYGIKITQKSYASQTSLIESLLKDLDASYLQESIEKIAGCREIIIALQETQNDFEEAHKAYNEAKINQKSKENATSIKNKVIQLINEQLITYLRAMIQVDEEKYSHFADAIATLINENNEMIRKRKNATDF